MGRVKPAKNCQLQSFPYMHCGEIHIKLINFLVVGGWSCVAFSSGPKRSYGHCELQLCATQKDVAALVELYRRANFRNC